MEEKSNFCHLHVHSDYSLLDGLGKVDEIVEKVKESGMTACALTDHGTMSGVIEFYDKCKEEGIKPIIGCECYEAPGSRLDKEKQEERYFHIILLVKNKLGYENLCKLVTRSNTEGFYYKPRIDFELLEQFHDGLICMSACIGGRIPQEILKGNDEIVKNTILRYKDLFKDDFYLEIQNHGIPEEQMVADKMVYWGKELGVKLVCTNDCHYVNSEDAEAHEWLLCIQTDKKIDDPDRMRYYGDYSVKTESEMRKLFPSLQDAFDNTMEIANKCNFDFVYGNYRMPKVIIPPEYGDDYFKYLEDESWKGFEKRYPEGHPEREQAKTDLAYELSVIKQMGFAEYFLDTRKTVLFAKNNNILVGPGRGSGAGSRLNYCLEITDIDPIKYNLLFERFLNPDRISMPDIDVDYSYEHKDEVIAFEAESNGIDKFTKINTFTTLLAKGVVRDLVRVAGMPVYVGDKFAALVGEDPDWTLQDAWDKNPDLRNFVNSDKNIEHIWKIAKRVEGTKKAQSTHACGHIPCSDKAENLFPCRVDSESGYLVSEYNMTEIEHLGNLKKDLLMLRNLTIISVAMESIKKRRGIDVPLWTDEILNDPDALALIASGDTDGVFQLESEGMKKFMRDLKPSSFEDIIAGVSLYRPGPMDYIPDYIKGKHDPSSISYVTPELEEILKPTYGILVYQEQVMQVVRKLAGFSMGRADLVRKAMSKKKMKIMQDERINFVNGNEELGIKGCINNGISEEAANKTYDDMIDFAKYAFNKSHAAAYAAISMQTAYLKAHYPEEFYAGLLSSVMDKTEKLAVYINKAKKRKLNILPPNINESTGSFTVTDKGILYGLKSIKGAGNKVIEKIIHEREENGNYIDFPDFLTRNQTCNKKIVEALINAGAFDFTGLTRCTLNNNKDNILSSLKTEKKNNIPGQMSLFDFIGKETKYSIVEYPEYPTMELLKNEKESTGLFISRHPMDQFREAAEKYGAVTVNVLNEELQEIYNEERQVFAFITDVRTIYTKKDAKKMAFVNMEDQTGEITAVVFPKTYEKYGKYLDEDMPIAVQGKISEKDGAANILADKIVYLPYYNKKLIACMSQREYNAKRERINEFVKKNSGIYRAFVVRINETGEEKKIGRIIDETLIDNDDWLLFPKGTLKLSNQAL